MRLAIIPARGGSKRIPNKNIRDFRGKPIIEWSIQAACASSCFDRVIVSTDSTSIAEIATAAGADVPFLRPKALADDHSGTKEVVGHAVQWFQERGLEVEHACCIYATAPLLHGDDIRAGLQTLLESGTDYALSVSSFTAPVQRALVLNDDRRLEMLNSSFEFSRSQDLVDTYYDAGQFCWGVANAWIELRSILSGSTAPVIIPRHRVVDIDTLEDWHEAELKMEVINSDKEKWFTR